MTPILRWLLHRHESPRRFLTAEERERVVAAIRAAESGTSGEIRVHAERRCKGDPLERARALFAELGMTATKKRNGVLLYVALADRRFAIYGDEAIHATVGDAYWTEIRDRLAARFREREFGDGIAEAVARIGEVLRASFPHEAGDVNELPDEPTMGDP